MNLFSGNPAVDGLGGFRMLSVDQVLAVAARLEQAGPMFDGVPAEEVAAWLGWEPVDSPYDGVLAVDIGLGVGAEDGELTHDDDGLVDGISVPVTNNVAAYFTEAADRFLRDAFALAGQALTDRYGEPVGRNPDLIWQLGPVALHLHQGPTTVSLDAYLDEHAP